MVAESRVVVGNRGFLPPGKVIDRPPRFRYDGKVTAPSVYRALLFMLAIVLPLPGIASSYLDTLRIQTEVLPNDEIRAAWVVRHALNSPDDVDRMIDYAVRARFHLLFVQVRGRGDAYYESTLEPRGLSLRAPIDSFDPLQYVLTRAHGEGISVHAWVNICYVWSDPKRDPPENHIVSAHPDWLMADGRGTRMDEEPVRAWKKRGLEGYYVSPAIPEVRAHTIAVVREIVDNYNVDGVHLDYVRYPNSNFDYSVGNRTAFALRYGVDPKALRDREVSLMGILGGDGVAFFDSLYTRWRVAQIDSIVRGIRQTIGDLPLSAAVIPEYDKAFIDKGQDWLGWIQRGDVDFVVPMAYAYTPDRLIERVKMIKRMVGARHFLIGLPAFDGKFQYLGYSVSLLRVEGVLGYSIFSYNSLREKRFSLEFLERVFFEEEAVNEADEQED
ncbi:MAG: family 10 glycosylhydrolase [bacterium]|nr:family 10 glycosylhydrolase [bacterium]